MKIKLPSLEDQKEIVAQKEKKIRTSFEFTEKVLQLLEQEAEQQGCPPSELFRKIIEETHIDSSQFQKRLKNLTIFQAHADKLQAVGESLIPDKYKGKRGVNKSLVAETLIKEYFHQQKQESK